jgi:hypothetical protein
MEKKICKICEIEKTLESFYLCAKCRKGRMAICKICILDGRKSQYDKVHKFNQEFRKDEKTHFSLAGCTPKDYMDMYEVLKGMGYDVEGDVHQQFLDRHNVNEKTPMKYKKRKTNTDSHYLPDGSVNPKARKSYYIKKTPTE